MNEPILNSPITHKPMVPVTLESGLQALRCPDSGGHYITANAYMLWLIQQPARLEHLPQKSAAAAHAHEDSTEVLVCPESGTLMSRYKVGHGFGFSIDRSITGGVWLDGGEWEALRERNFHDEIHLVFTAPWQKQVRDDRAMDVYEAKLKSSLGEDLLCRLTELRRELASHPHRNLALSYITNRANSLERAEA